MALAALLVAALTASGAEGAENASALEPHDANVARTSSIDAATEPSSQAANDAAPDATVASGDNDESRGQAPEDASTDMRSDAAILRIDLSDDERTATVRLDDTMIPDATAVSFPTWSAINGQDDIIWHRAAPLGDGSWQASFPLSLHASAGSYIVHAYATMQGSQRFVGGATFEVVAPRARIEATPQTTEQMRSGAFSLRITVESAPSGIMRVQVPLWSTERGQDDIEWLEAKRDAADPSVWTVEASLAHPLREPGSYLAHAYVTTGNGIFAYAGQGAFSVAMDEATLSATVSDDQGSVTLHGTGGWFAHASSVLFPTWSLANGQDDLIWHAARRCADGWEATIAITDHASAGSYAIHAYGTVGGRQRFIKGASFDIEAPCANVSMSQDEEQRRCGSFTITISIPEDSKASAARRVQVPVWSADGGQDDIEWLEARRVDEATWITSASLAHPRRNAGDYIAHVYITCENGVFAYAGAAKGVIELSPSILEATLSADQMTATITAQGGMFALATSLSAPTWSLAGGQDDIVWYRMQRTDGIWQATVPISSHRSAGSYAVHLYGTIGGTSRFLGADAFSVDAPASATIEVVTDDANGIITVTISDVASQSGISHVQVPTWTTAGGQDDIVWHDARRMDDGSFQATIPASQHRCEEGPYLIHVYATAGNGVMGFVGSGSASLALADYIAITGTGPIRTLWLRNPSISNADVYAPTWSVANGQDDIVWYPVYHQGDGLWLATIDCRNLLHSGVCVAHVYAGSTMLGAASFTASDTDVVPIVQYHNIAWAGQPNGFYCGSTSGYMILRHLGATRSAQGAALTINNVARLMDPEGNGIGMRSRDFERAVNAWLGYNAYTTIEHPSYETVRAAILDSYRTGYPVAVHTYEYRGGAHYNGHANSSMGHVMVVDGYDRVTDSVLIVDPWAGVWTPSSQKFWYGSLREFTKTFITPSRGIYLHR